MVTLGSHSSVSSKSKVRPRDKRLKTDCWFSFQFILALIMKMLDTEKQTLFG